MLLNISELLAVVLNEKLLELFINLLLGCVTLCLEWHQLVYKHKVICFQLTQLLDYLNNLMKAENLNGSQDKHCPEEALETEFFPFYQPFVLLLFS